MSKSYYKKWNAFQGYRDRLIELGFEVIKFDETFWTITMKNEIKKLYARMLINDKSYHVGVKCETISDGRYLPMKEYHFSKIKEFWKYLQKIIDGVQEDELDSEIYTRNCEKSLLEERENFIKLKDDLERIKKAIVDAKERVIEKEKELELAKGGKLPVIRHSITLR